MRFDELNDSTILSSEYYGYASEQISMLNGMKLHNLGFRGKGMTIAIIDGGFHNADAVKLLDNVKILGTHNFVRPRAAFMQKTNTAQTFCRAWEPINRGR